MNQIFIPCFLCIPWTNFCGLLPSGGQQVEQPVGGGGFAPDGQDADNAVFVGEGTVYRS